MDLIPHKAEAQCPPGTVYLVGAGPGDPDLLTQKAAKVLARADAVVYDNLVGSEVLGLCAPSAELHFAGKEKGRHNLAQPQIQSLLEELAGRHGTVVRLKGGDPFIFGRGGEELVYLTARGIPVEVIPGITAASGAAAALGLPLTHRGLSAGLVFLSGHRQQGGDYEEFRGIDLNETTCVVYMGLSVLGEILARICERPANSLVAACAIERATRRDQRVILSRVCDLAEDVVAAQLRSPVLIVLGRVVGLLSRTELAQVVANSAPELVEVGV